jgi:hypothetical protein
VQMIDQLDRFSLEHFTYNALSIYPGHVMYVANRDNGERIQK